LFDRHAVEANGLLQAQAQESAGMGTLIESDPIETTSEFAVLSVPFGTEYMDPIFGQRAAVEQKAYMTFAPIDATGQETSDESPMAKRQRDEAEEEGTVQVIFDMSGGRIQIMKYSAQQGWEQQGRELRVNYMDGDRFRAQLGADGAVEIYRNGKSLATRDVAP
jgi:hypothetical protein